MAQREYPRLFLLILPAGIVFAAFFILPVVQLALVGASGPDGLTAYASILTKPRHLESLIATLVLSAGVTAVAVAISTVAWTRVRED